MSQIDIKIKDVLEELEKIAPQHLADPWDNVGLLVGECNQKVENVYLCLDPTLQDVKEAVKHNANMMVTHHPLNVKPFKKITVNKMIHSVVAELLKNNIALFAMHTNFDRVEAGLNDILAEKLGLVNVKKFKPELCVDEFGNDVSDFGRLGDLKYPVVFFEFVKNVKQTLNCEYVRYLGDKNKTIKNLALLTGGGADYLYSAYKNGAELFLTGDVTHHKAQLACELGMCLIDAGHFETEILICDFLEKVFNEKFPSLSVKKSTTKPFLQLLTD